MILPALLSLVAVARVGASSETLTPSTPPAVPFISSVSSGNVETVQLPRRSYPKEFWQQWRTAFPPEHDLHNSFDSGSDPAKALDVINAAFCFCLLQGQLHGFLPPALIHKLQTLPYDPEAPCALVIRGLPVDPHVPPTPTVTTNEFYTKSRATKCPVAETMLLGVSRLLGTPHGPKMPPQSHLVRDLMPTSRAEMVDAHPSVDLFVQNSILYETQ
uniref:Uncharacterized protein n=1 Tax=Pseudictyota dubia TaxID=2749911 RepID=A0A7R9W9J2_9STRA